MLYGLAAALGWGLADFMVAMIARRIGSFRTVVLAQGAALLAFTVLAASHVERVPAWHPALLALPAVGVLGAIAYLAFYRALELGPIALVSPIVAGYAAIVIGLSLAILHEAVPGLALAGAGVAICGVALASTDPRALRTETRTPRARSGLFFAVIAMTAFGVGAFLIGRYSKEVGWFGAIYLSRIGSAVTLIVISLLRTDRRFRGMGLRLVAWAALCGLLDIGGFAAFARGSELGLVSITAAASVTYPLIPIVFGVLHFRERPAPSQWAGVAAVGCGLALLALGR
jgi:drug/metabolite transporter (DMT)-like permease